MMCRPLKWQADRTCVADGLETIPSSRDKTRLVTDTYPSMNDFTLFWYSDSQIWAADDGSDGEFIRHVIIILRVHRTPSDMVSHKPPAHHFFAYAAIS